MKEFIISDRQESETIEFKEGLSEKEDAGEALVAFANKSGGVVYFGVRNNGVVKGLDGVSEKTIRDLSQIYTDNTDPKLYPLIEFGTCEDKLIIRMEIKKSTTPYHTFRSHGYIRVASSDKKMTQEELHSRWMEYHNDTYDFSSEVCKGLNFEDLDPSAIDLLRTKWSEKEQNEEYLQFSHRDALTKLLLMRGEDITFAGLLLCGKPEAISRFLPEAEIRFGWKNNPQELDFNFAKDWRAPFLKIFDDIWGTINARNTRFPVEQGFFEGDIWAFDQKSVREALLNAFAHRNYQERGSIFIEVAPQHFIIKSPGRFITGVSSENILDVQGKWRNRLLMETLGKIGLVERYGHGVDRIFRKTISDGKGKPVIEEINSAVRLYVPTQVKDQRFILFLTKIAKEKQIDFDFVKDLLFLDDIREKQFSNDRERRDKFFHLGIIEKMGKGRGVRYILSQRLYNFFGEPAEYTRKKWLAKAQQKEVLLRFFQQHKKGKMVDFRDGLFEGRLTNDQILQLLYALRDEEKIYFEGPQRSPAAYWVLKS